MEYLNSTNIFKLPGPTGVGVAARETEERLNYIQATQSGCSTGRIESKGSGNFWPASRGTNLCSD